MTFVLLLAGCAAPSPGGTTAPTATSSPGATATSAPPVTPAPTVTVTAPPAERGPESPYDLFDAWLSCRDLTTYFYPDPGRVEFSPFEESEVVNRNDGLIYVYIPTIDRSDGEDRELASECILGGTLGDPNQALFGTAVRSDDRDPDMPLPTA